MANKKISELNSITNAGLATTDVIPVVDVSVVETKKIAISELDLRYTNETYVDAGDATTLSSAQSYADSGISTHSADTTSVHGIADTSALVTKTGSEELTNKKLTGGTASSSRVWTIPSNTKANLDALTRVAGAIYYATDDDLFYKDNGSTLVALTAANAKVFAMAEFSTNVAVSGRLNFDSVLSDALSTITTGASWVFTAPRDDTYRVNVNYQGNAGAAMHIYANGSFYRGISDVVSGLSVSSTVDVPLLSGQTLYIVEASSGYTSQGGGNVNWIQIVA